MKDFLRFLKCVLWYRQHEYTWIRKFKDSPDLIVKKCQRCGHESEVTVSPIQQAKVTLIHFEQEG